MAWRDRIQLKPRKLEILLTDVLLGFDLVFFRCQSRFSNENDAIVSYAEPFW